MSEASSASVSQWIAGLKEGEQDAAERLWLRYSAELAKSAKRRLANSPPVLADEEDIVLMAFDSLCRAAAAGRLQKIADRDELWWILLEFVNRKIVDEVRRENAIKRGNGKVQNVSNLQAGPNGTARFTFEQLMDERPTPEYFVALQEQLNHLLNCLRDERSRRIAAMRIEGYSIREIAAQLDVTTKTIGRKLRLIRAAWSEELLREQ